MGEQIKILAGTAHPELARDIASELGVPLASASVGRFPDGEIDIKINEDMRGCDAFVVQPTCPPVNESLVELLLLLDCLKRASARRITAVVPYFGYARKDRKDEGRVPISAKVVANAIVSAGADRVLTVDLHASQIQGFFDIPVDHLYARPVMLEALRELEIPSLTVVSPDVGGIRLARAYARALDAGLAIIDKRRVSGESTVTENLIGEVNDRNVLLVDDMVSTAGSISGAVRLLKEAGAGRAFIAATHAVLCGPARERLEQAEVERILFTDTIPPQDGLGGRVQTVSIAPLLARAIDRIHHESSVSALFED